MQNDFIGILNVCKGKKSRPFIFIFGSGEAGSPGSLSVLSMNENGHISLALEVPELEFIETTDLDHDSICEIVGLPCYHQGDPYGYTYDPFHVYKLNPSTNKFKLDLKLSEIYNKKHYAGWVGADCSEEYRVCQLDSNKKGVIMKLEVAKQIFEKRLKVK